MNLTSQGKRKLTTRQKQLVVHLGRHKVLKKDINSLGSIYSSSFLAIDYFVLPYINKTYILSTSIAVLKSIFCTKNRKSVTFVLFWSLLLVTVLGDLKEIIFCHFNLACHRYNLFIFKVRTPLKRTSGPFFLQVLSINYKIGC